MGMIPQQRYAFITLPFVKHTTHAIVQKTENNPDMLKTQEKILAQPIRKSHNLATYSQLQLQIDVQDLPLVASIHSQRNKNIASGDNANASLFSIHHWNTMHFVFEH